MRILSLFEENHVSAKILDVGCGNGAFSAKVGKRVSSNELYGIDINASAVKDAKRYGINVVIADAHCLPFKEEIFDIIVSNQVVEHLLNVDMSIREVQRTLKGSGQFIVSTPNLCSFHNRVLVILGKQPTCLHVGEVQVGNPLRGVRTHGHIHAFSPAALNDLLMYHHFTIEKRMGSGMYPFPHILQRILSKIFPSLAVHLIYKTRKKK